ncbi:MAG: type II secretion system major pseudopilin GspG [Phycisphaerae bacterium]|nr:type II secretion system major pseudopilin GspG [Phycisphaerae bacterium]
MSTLTLRRSRPARPAVRRRRGFTILELLIVIGILIAIMGIVLYNVMGASEKADKKITVAQIKGFEGALDMFKADLKRWPSEEEGLAVLWNKDALANDDDKAKWGGPYMKEPKPKDGWGHPWVFRIPSQTSGLAFDIVSSGPDGLEGTEDDISNSDNRKNADGEVDESFKDFSNSSDSSGKSSG